MCFPDELDVSICLFDSEFLKCYILHLISYQKSIQNNVFMRFLNIQ